MTWSLSRGSAACLLAILFAGCGGSGPPVPELAAVAGTVMQGGKPLPEAIVSFVPETGGRSVGITDKAGKFELKYGGTVPGAVLGKHHVTISKMSGEAGDELIPRKYNDASKISKEVSQAGPNEFNFEI